MIRGILAHDDDWGIGKSDTLPWPHNSEDLKWFKGCTNNSTVIMGRRTWDSLPKKPLPNRANIVISSRQDFTVLPTAVYSGSNIPKIISEIVKRYVGDIWFIGGAQVIEASLGVIDELWLNNIHGVYQCDTFLPKNKIMTIFEPYHQDNTSYSTITKWKKRATVS